MRELQKALLQSELWIGLVIIAGVVLSSGLMFLWFQKRKRLDTMLEVIRFGLWCSKHQTIYSGNTADYFDADLFLGEPRNIGLVASWFKEELQHQRDLTGRIDRLAFIEKEEGSVGALTLKDLLSWETRLPGAIVRPRRKGPS